VSIDLVFLDYLHSGVVYAVSPPGVFEFILAGEFFQGLGGILIDF